MTSGALGTVRVLICEDEPLAVRALRSWLDEVAWIEVVGEAREGGEALRLLHKHEPELVFMDVRMPGMSGVEVLEAMEHRPAVVFTTAFDEYALRAFELGAVDYLVKPFGRERLLETLDRVRVRLVGEGRATGPGPEDGVDTEPGLPGGGGRAYVQRLFARHRGAVVPVPVAEIRRVDAASGGVTLSTQAGDYELDATLAEVEERLDPRDFVRVHRAHLVNLAHVTRIRPYDARRLSLTLDDDTTLVASRRGSQELRALMEG